MEGNEDVHHDIRHRGYKYMSEAALDRPSSLYLNYDTGVSRAWLGLSATHISPVNINIVKSSNTAECMLPKMRTMSALVACKYLRDISLLV